MLRPFTVLLATAATLVTLHAAPAQARLDTDVIAGHTEGRSGILLKGCHRYSFAYVVQVPTEDWALEVSIVDRRGHGVASFAFLGPVDPKSATATYRLCRNSTVPGKFRIRTTLNWFDDPSTPIPVAVPVSRFRLTHP